MTTVLDARRGPGAAVRAHYDELLGPIYEWMVGGFDQAMAAARVDVQALGLGAGLGAHTLALADAGYVVTAIDTCAALVDQLRARARRHAVVAVQDDLVNLRRHNARAVRVMLCMGDTLTHLPSLEMVAQLFDEAAAILTPGGVFAATFRDYTGGHLTGAKRVIPVRQDGARTLTCVLEYRSSTVIVHDVVHERADSTAAPRVGHYRKLRLDPEWARAALQQRGLAARLEPAPGGMVRLVAVRAV